MGTNTTHRRTNPLRRWLAALSTAAMALTTVAAASQTERITASDGAEMDVFGESVAVDGEVAVVGSSSGAYVLRIEDDGSTTQTAKLVGDGVYEFDSFGIAVDIDGDTIVVGAPKDNQDGNDAGAVYVFKLADDGSAALTAKLTPGAGASPALFGHPVAISGDTVLVGAHLESSSGGAAYVFKLADDGTATQTARLTPDAPGQFGLSLAVHGDTAIVGAPTDAGNGHLSGAAYVYRIAEDGTAVRTERIVPADNAQHDQFGNSVAIGDGVAIITAPVDEHDGSSRGSVYVYEITDASTAIQTDKIVPPVGADTTFGYKLSMDGRTALVGRGIRYGLGVDQDVPTYVDVFSVGGDGTATLTDTLVGEGGAVGRRELFGFATALSGDVALVGAPYADDFGRLSGAAYLFELEREADVVPPTFEDVTIAGQPVMDGDTVTVAADDPYGAVVGRDVTGSDDVDGPLVAECDPPADETLPVGTTTVTCTLTDEAGNTAQLTVDVTVVLTAETFDGMLAIIEDLDLPHGNARALSAKIEAAQQQFANGEYEDAASSIDAFLSLVDALEGVRIDADDAAVLREAGLLLLAAIEQSSP